MSNRTIVYYTANTEKESFEKKVVENILQKSNGLPIISVSQKPMDFGKNICVGKLEQNYQNAFKQALIGCEKAETEFVVMCESDCLYPEGYFDFIPTKKDVVYTYDNVWLMWDRENRTRFYKHGTTAGSIMLSRELYIKLMTDGMSGFKNKNLKWETFTGKPLINVKTRNGISFGTTLEKGINPVKNLPEWGTVEDVKKRFLN